jgi:hypothetical protein
MTRLEVLTHQHKPPEEQQMKAFGKEHKSVIGQQ